MTRRRLTILGSEPDDLVIVAPVVEPHSSDLPIVEPRGADLPIIAPVVESRGADAPVIPVEAQPVDLLIVATVIEPSCDRAPVVGIAAVVRIAAEARVKGHWVEALSHALGPTLIDDAREDHRCDVGLLAHDQRTVLPVYPVDASEQDVVRHVLRDASRDRTRRHRDRRHAVPRDDRDRMSGDDGRRRMPYRRYRSNGSDVSRRRTRRSERSRREHREDRRCRRQDSEMHHFRAPPFMY